MADRAVPTLVSGSVGLISAITAAPLWLSRHDDGGGTTPPASSAPPITGTLWLLIDVGGRQGIVNLERDHPASIGLTIDGAWIEFERDGTLLANDGVNVINGTYRVTTDALDLRSTSMTGAVSVPPSRAGEQLWPHPSTSSRSTLTAA